MKRARLLLAGLLLLLFVSPVEAGPARIVLIRHADKLPQKDCGPALSPKGQVRAERFVAYYLEHFGAPDFILATHPVSPDPAGSGGKLAGYELSIREIQTVAPLANHLAHVGKEAFPIDHPYAADQVAALAAELFTEARYDGKNLLVCWDHYNIPRVLKALRVSETVAPVPGDAYDWVYVIRYRPDGRVEKLDILKDQYPVGNPGTWEDLCGCCPACSGPK